MRNKFVGVGGGALASVKNSVIALLYRADLRVGNTVTELGSLKAVGVSGSQAGRHQVATRNHQQQDGRGSCRGQQRPSSNQNSLNCADLNGID